MKKSSVFTLTCTVILTLFLFACDKEPTVSTVATEQPAVTATVTSSEKAEQKPSEKAKQKPSEKTEQKPSETTATVLLTDDGNETYEFVDSTPTNPTVRPYEIPQKSVDLSLSDFKGNWKPLMATQVSDNREIALNKAFGMVYLDEGGLFTADENGNFTLKVGVAVDEGKSKGKFTLSDNHLLVTYSDGTPDTFLYIPSYQNCQVVKVQVNSYYVYFYKT